MKKLLRVDMNMATAVVEDLPDKYRLLGNRGLVAKVLNEEVDPTCDPLGTNNKLVFALGLLAGTGFPTGNRLSVGVKSPLTGGIKEANSGGNIGSQLAHHGIQLIIVENQPNPSGLFLLHIPAEGTPRLLKADHYAGIGTYALVENLKHQFGDKIAVACIGPAGERRYKNSTIQVTDYSTGHPSRAMARGGIGAVMGSKGLKAIVVDRPKHKTEVQYADKDKFAKAMKAYLEVLHRNAVTSTALPMFGTMVGMAVTAKTGALPVKNFSGERCGILEEIGAHKFHQNINRRGGKTGLACQPGCPIRCSNIYNDKQGNYLTSGFEYETVALLGANCNIADLDIIAQMERKCDDFGLDTIELGAAIAVCMEAGKIPWGDGEKAMALLQEITDDTKFGRILAQGTQTVGEYLHAKHVPVVKGQALPGYDPRNSKGTGVGYATSPMGGDHTVGTTSGMPGDSKKTGRAKMSQLFQVAYATVDNFMCHFASFPLTTTHRYAVTHIAEALAGRYGGDWTENRVWGIGLETLALEKGFNRRAGFTAKDDRLPRFFYDEASPMTGATFDITDEELAEVLPF
ncbi:MAG: aldehyde ferredoxin oxidoreductase [Desulfobacteraceae bacterium]|nr:aldehyde ferredoxin oxidoreductase [Desulfobacteraceae bacterium]